MPEGLRVLVELEDDKPRLSLAPVYVPSSAFLHPESEHQLTKERLTNLKSISSPIAQKSRITGSPERTSGYDAA
jgi:hypothetical protein